MEISSTSFTSESERFAIAYLERYEAMIQTQEEEDKATISHLQPIFQSIQRLGGGSGGGKNTNSNGSGESSDGPIPIDTCPFKQLSMAQAQVQVQDTSFTANHDETFLHVNTSSASTKGGKNNSNNNMNMNMNNNASLSIVSMGADREYSSLDRVSNQTMKRFMENPLLLTTSDAKDYEVLQTDEQLCMVLDKIVEKYSSVGGGDSGEDANTNANDHHNDDNDNDNERNDDSMGMSFAEFVHVYKIAVSGMQAMQMLPEQDADDICFKDRDRTKQRTLLMISLFSNDAISEFRTGAQQEGRAQFIPASNISNASIISNDNDDNDDDYDDDDDDYDEVVDDSTMKEALLNKEFLQREEKILAVARNKEDEVEKLRREIGKAKRRSLILAFLCILLVLICAGAGYHFQEQIDSQVMTELQMQQSELASLKKEIAPQLKDCQDFVCTKADNGVVATALADTEQKLSSAFNQIGNMVLELSNQKEALSRCLANVNTDTSKAALECEPCISNSNESEAQVIISDLTSARREIKRSAPLKALVIRRQIFAAVGAASLVVLPSIFPMAGIFQKLLKILRIAR
eukprot:CAMPEP_0194086518 /NCGR_PEP_ID=MMETSP0149-20130528/21386_1 /TAXON_ID=122233 /ORGANISM="Chaetoceros debilis, Strain MM31A-1" /LENGTH=574 /DNA_ID=CAMNT_0038769621 /DNA_START=357 /DNA_END=2081 /DNA_ORIENTATION=-